MADGAAPPPAGPVEAALAVRLRCSVERLAADSIHALVLLRLERPPTGAVSTAPFVEIRRACSHRPPEVQIDDLPEAWARAIEDELLRTLKEIDPAVQRLHRDLDMTILRVLDDPATYRKYFDRLAAAVALGLSAAEGAGAEEVEGVHRAFVAPWVGDAGVNVSIEYRVSPAAPRAEAVAAGAGEAVAAGMRMIPFAGSLKGVQARELKPGAVIMPEKNRERRYVVVDVQEGAELGTVSIFCRSEGTPADRPADAFFTVAELARVPIESGETEGVGGFFSTPLGLAVTAAVVFAVVYVLIERVIGL